MTTSQQKVLLETREPTYIHGNHGFTVVLRRPKTARSHRVPNALPSSMPCSCLRGSPVSREAKKQAVFFFAAFAFGGPLPLAPSRAPCFVFLILARE
eukprot:scaffold85617_cov33-Tisochrysis_lutea.AAC.2